MRRTAVPAVVEDFPMRVAVPGLRVLVVDDDRELGGLVVDSLTQAGVEAELVSDGDIALARLSRAEKLPHVIVLDLELPGLNGWDLLAVLRSQPRLATLPVVLMSGHDPRDATDYARVTHLSKPFDVRSLLAAVRQAARAVPRG
jgi:DNA-binding response OmpR family regulator